MRQERIFRQNISNTKCCKGLLDKEPALRKRACKVLHGLLVVSRVKITVLVIRQGNDPLDLRLAMIRCVDSINKDLLDQ